MQRQVDELGRVAEKKNLVCMCYREWRWLHHQRVRLALQQAGHSAMPDAGAEVEGKIA